jgi:amino-acid N-acetyltransferase
VSVAIGTARPHDEPAILALLNASGLPLDGAADCLSSAFVAREGERIVGVAALEIYADGGLLRSMAVASSARGRGIGQALTTAVLDLAAIQDLPAVYLLTTTAEGFFPKFGFVPVSRDDVPAGVQQSIEFRSACPSSAVVMRRTMDRR